MRLKGYSVGDAVWEEPSSVVFAGTESGTNRRVLIRTPKPPGRSLEGSDRLRRDYEIALALPPELVVKRIALERFETGEALVLEDAGARPLQLVVAVRRLDLLEVLVRHAGQVLSRVQLLDLVWGLELDAETNTVDVFVGYLRRKLEAEGEARLIHTVRGVGYVVRAP